MIAFIDCSDTVLFGLLICVLLATGTGGYCIGYLCGARWANRAHKPHPKLDDLPPGWDK
jgi:hypothetical protein